jgi:hypothetical protein
LKGKNKMAQHNDEMSLSAALRKAKEKWPNFPIWAVRKAVETGVIPSRRSSLVKGARYYVRWQVLEAYWANLKV